ncbi:MAG: flagellar filament outer layer protein FlaA [Treponema sp.]|nr:flagellar filament outer layer protein FlaA [Treponema sp.]
MKQGSFRAVRLAVLLLVMLCLSSFAVMGDENTVDYESIILEPFDGNTSHQWFFGGKTYDFEFEWKADASKFASRIGEESYPKLSYIPSWPMALFGVNREEKEFKSLGIWGKFDRRGYNWIDIYPIIPGTGSEDEDPEPFEIPIPGRVKYLDMWVWGSNLNYYIEAYFRDHQGVVYNLYLGNLGYQGWKNLRTQIPTSIPQSKRVLPRFAGLTFVKFRIWTTPVERVDNFYIYFDQMKVLTDTFESLFDGDELADPERVQELWAQAAE